MYMRLYAYNNTSAPLPLQEYSNLREKLPVKPAEDVDNYLNLICLYLIEMLESRLTAFAKPDI